MKKYKMKLNKFMLTVGAVFIVMGFVFMLLGQNQAERDTVPAAATVTDYVEDTGNQGRLLVTVYYPVVTYEANGQTVTSQYSQRLDEQIYKIGESIDIKYDPDNPEEFIIVGDEVDSGMSGTWAIALGVVMAVIGLVMTLVKKK